MQAMTALETAIGRGQTEEIAVLTREFDQGLDLTAQTRKVLGDLAAKLPDLISKRDAIYLKSIDQLEEIVRDGLLKAKYPEDLNHFLSDLEVLKQGRREAAAQLQSASAARLANLGSTIATWQQYLRSKNSGYFAAAETALRSLMDQRGGSPIVPAEDVQRLIAALRQAGDGPFEAANNILRSVRAVSDIPAAAKKIAQIPTSARQTARS